MSIKFENTEVTGWEHTIRGMRNPMNSWDRSDSGQGCSVDFMDRRCVDCDRYDNEYEYGLCRHDKYVIGPNDMDLMRRLAAGGPVHAKYRRMITVYVDITAPLYWWKEFDTYKVGTVANSCSTMHKIAEKEFTLEDFSTEHLLDTKKAFEENASLKEAEGFAAVSVDGNVCYYSPKYFIQMTCDVLNRYRKLYLETKDKTYWWQMIQLLPSSYNQKRTVMMNYEVLANIYKSRRNHKLDEWAEHKDVNITNGEKVVRTIPNQYQGFCDWIKTLPYSELITGDWSE